MSTDITNNAVDEFLAFNKAKNEAAPRGGLVDKVKNLISQLDKTNPDHYVKQSTLSEYLGCSPARIHGIMGRLVDDKVVRVDDSERPFKYYPA